MLNVTVIIDTLCIVHMDFCVIKLGYYDSSNPSQDLQDIKF